MEVSINTKFIGLSLVGFILMPKVFSDHMLFESYEDLKNATSIKPSFRSLMFIGQNIIGIEVRKVSMAI